MLPRSLSLPNPTEPPSPPVSGGFGRGSGNGLEEKSALPTASRERGQEKKRGWKGREEDASRSAGKPAHGFPLVLFRLASSLC